jgi:hypothetical protein
VDADADLAGPGLGHVPLDEFQDGGIADFAVHDGFHFLSMVV